MRTTRPNPPLSAVTATTTSSAILTERIAQGAVSVTVADASSLDGTLTVEASLDYPSGTNLPASYTPTNWATIQGSTTALTADGTTIAWSGITPYPYIRIVFTLNSGSGTVTANFFGQGWW